MFFSQPLTGRASRTGRKSGMEKVTAGALSSSCQCMGELANIIKFEPPLSPGAPSGCEPCPGICGVGMGVEECLSEHICTELPAVAAWRKMSLSILETCPCLMKELSSSGLHKACGAKPASQLLPMFTFPPCIPSAAF